MEEPYWQRYWHLKAVAWQQTDHCRMHLDHLRLLSVEPNGMDEASVIHP